MATYAIGDIHGALKALQQLLERVNPQSEDQLIFLGDLVDGWSESAQTIDFVMKLSRDIPCIFIKGNHDVFCENWLTKGEKSTVWQKHGGRATINSYRMYSVEQKQRHIDFFSRMPLYHIDEENRLFVHAGFTSMHGPNKEQYKSMFTWDRTLWEMAMVADASISIDSTAYPKRLKHFNEIYIGHTPTQSFGGEKPMHKMNVWNVDTGAAFKGKLSAIEVGTENVWQSDEAWILYPDEKGRN